VLEENYFVNNVQQAVLRRLSAAELAEIAGPYAEPGEGRRPRHRPACRRDQQRAAAISKWSNLTEVAVTGLHWTPEDDPHGIGSAVNTWIKKIRG
jgi:haloalkane dehalogenase